MSDFTIAGETVLYCNNVNILNHNGSIWLSCISMGEFLTWKKLYDRFPVLPSTLSLRADLKVLKLFVVCKCIEIPFYCCCIQNECENRDFKNLKTMFVISTRCPQNPYCSPKSKKHEWCLSKRRKLQFYIFL